MAEDIKLCHLTDIENGESAGFTCPVNGRDQSILAVRKGDRLFVYINSCPHIRIPLNLDTGFSDEGLHGEKFLSLDKQHIQCSTHGAQFQIEDGFCIYGPCKNESLEPVPVVIREGSVYVSK